MAATVVVRQLGHAEYLPVWQAMQDFTTRRSDDTADELWIVEHPPVFTLGRAGKSEHLLAPGDIPVLHVDRGGQVTYHGPGQLVVYLLLALPRHQLGVRALVDLIEQSLLELLAGYGIQGITRNKAPGIYVAEHKIAALGLRVRRGCSYHGLSLNVDMDLQPFTRINPCGYPGLKVTQLADLNGPRHLATVATALLAILTTRLGYAKISTINTLPGPLQDTP
ncbi:MAG: lipoyl(octanoyl) transferase LipB [Gammaproteobacteria bacterium]|nr:lipoyl(octanoyl) transferase LipB [Gammaproteobacteria bacterium]